MLYIKIVRKLKYVIGKYLIQYPRILKYKIISNCRNIRGNLNLIQPTLILGEGQVEFGNNVALGVNPSPCLYNGYGHIEVRNKQSKVTIGNNVWINNNIIIISEGEGIEIGENTLIGFNVEITDTDFHDLCANKRSGGGNIKTAKVDIGRNVFIGSNVKILKGVTIGKNSIIANSSVVIKSIPSDVVAGGYPCKVIEKIDFN